jgi:hypothetical protein
LDLLGLQTGDLIAIIASGYLGFKISQLGDQKKHSAEDVLLQSFIFGILATVSARLLLVDNEGFILIRDRPLPSSPNAVLIFSIGISSVAGVLWRGIGQPFTSFIMRSIGVYQGDNHSTVLRSISNSRATWYYVTVHRKDGTILTSDISATAKYIPLRGVTINDDGMCLYVTSVARPNGTSETFQVTEAELSTLTYVPFSEIQQVDVTWR